MIYTCVNVYVHVKCKIDKNYEFNFSHIVMKLIRYPKIKHHPEIKNLAVHSNNYMLVWYDNITLLKFNENVSYW